MHFAEQDGRGDPQFAAGTSGGVAHRLVSILDVAQQTFGVVEKLALRRSVPMAAKTSR